MSLQLFNSLTREKEIFKPRNGKNVQMYVCGITPNNATHLGHAFTYVSFDVLVRYLQYKDYAVNYLQNATDINDGDDVILQARETGKTWEEEASYWIKHFHKQMDALNVLRPTHFVLATSVIDKIIDTNVQLLKKGYAYEKNGTVYFDISKFKRYGQLSRYTPSQMLYISRDRGNNVEDLNKKNPLDFVLWIRSKQKPHWNSPWGYGRPGWHIECSTMIQSILGPQIDIHGGGRDLIYPHHDSEIAQSEAYSNTSPFVKYWMHTSMVLCEGEKMSKSLGNLILLSDLLKKYSAEAIRWMILSHHYREPWEFEETDLKKLEEKVARIRKALLATSVVSQSLGLQFEKSMNDDLNTPLALQHIEEWISKNKKTEAKYALQVLGIYI